MANGKLDEGILVLTQALSAKPGSVPLRYNLSVGYNKKRDYKKSLDEMKLVFNYKPTLRHAVQLLVVFEQRYIILFVLAFLITLFGSLFFRMKVLLLFPSLVVVQGWVTAYNLIRKRKWMDAVLLIIVNILITMLIYIFYKAH